MKKSGLLLLSSLTIALTGCDFLFGGPIPDPTPSIQMDNLLTYHDMKSNYKMKALVSEGIENMLVIPVVVSDYSQYATNEVHDVIEKAFFGAAEETSWESLSSYYSTSSFGKLDLQGTVTPWWNPGYSSTQIASMGTGELLKRAVNWYKSTYQDDMLDFDMDEDGFIDGVWMVYSAPDYRYARYSENVRSTFWAYTSWETSTKANQTSPNPNLYAWASFDFIYNSYGIDAHTLIHETGHMLGLDDYYSYDADAGSYGPMGKVDMMDNNIIDHDVWSKMALGWVRPYVVEESMDIVLEPSWSSGDCVLIPTEKGYNGTSFGEYLMLEYYEPEGLNKKDSESSYLGYYPRGFTVPGVRIYHVNSTLFTIVNDAYYGHAVEDPLEEYENGTALITAYSNTRSRSLNSSYRLIKAISSKKIDFDKTNVSATADNTLFRDGDTFSIEEYASLFPNRMESDDGTSFRNLYIEFSENGGVMNLSISMDDL